MNSVQYGMEVPMNKIITSREALLLTAKTIVIEQGADSLNMRNLAKQSGVATGSVYNYFSSKAEVLIALVEDFWRTIYFPKFQQITEKETFLETVQFIYETLGTHLVEFRQIYLGTLSLLSAEEKQKGRSVEQEYMKHIKQHLLQLLNKDPAINPQVWNEVFTKERFLDFLFTNIITMLTKGISDCSFLLELLQKILME